METQWRREMGAVAGALTATLKNAVYPPACLICREAIDGAGQLCPACWREVHFLAGPVCDRCGIPFDFELPEGALCASCVATPPQFDRARAVFMYTETSKRLVLSLKHGDRTDLAPVLAAWMARAGRDMFAEADLVVPVPLHWRRRVWRRFNQSAELARPLSRETGVPAHLALLERHRPGPSQGALSRRARGRNVAGSFRLRADEKESVEGQHIVLIDDVMTTGATANACARTLRRAGARQIDVLTVARVALPGQSAI